MSTKPRRQRLLLLLVLACTLSIVGCKTGSKLRALPQLAPEAPEVRCKQPTGPVVPPLPRADEWVEWVPPRPGVAGTVEARLSEKAANWVIESLSVQRVIYGYRAIEHECLDRLEAEGLIRQ